eukprot:317716_1
MSKQYQPTPVSVIIALYQKPNRPPLIIEKIDELPIKQQMALLTPAQCGTTDGRNEVVRRFNNEDMTNNAYKRIRFKALLSSYHKHWTLIKDAHFKMVENWTDRDFSLNVIVHFVLNKDIPQNETDDKQKKRLNTTWRFVDFLRQFFRAKNFNGKEFISKHGGGPNQNNDSKKKSSGFGLTIVKDVCKQFDQKTGQYTKVKKQLSAWAKNNVERHNQEQKFSFDDMKLPVIEENGNDVAPPMNTGYTGHNNNNPQPTNNQIPKKQTIQNNGGDGSKWYWFCDEGNIKWIPYREEHQRVIDEAWNNHKNQVIVAEKFKIELHRDGPNPAGQQYNYLIHNSWRRGVIKGVPDDKGLLNDIPCDKNPR